MSTAHVTSLSRQAWRNQLLAFADTVSVDVSNLIDTQVNAERLSVKKAIEFKSSHFSNFYERVNSDVTWQILSSQNTHAYCGDK